MKFAKGLVGFVTWLLFAASFALLANQTWYALQGAQPNYGTEGAAYIITAIISATSLAMFFRLLLHMDKTPMQLGITLFLLAVALGIDVTVAVSIIFELDFPEQFALFVILAHVLSHVVQYSIIALQGAGDRFGDNPGAITDATALLELLELSGALQTMHRCPDCNRVFKSERGLQQHRRHCKAK